MDNFRPTAERQPAALLGELKSKARSLVATISREEELNLERAAELGRTLELIRERCKDGEWGRAIEELGLTRGRASEFRRIAKLSKGELSMCGSIRGAVEYANTLSPNKAPDGEESDSAVRRIPAGSAESAAGWPLENRCRECRVSGRNDPNCKLCKEKNAPEEEAEAHEELMGRHPTGSRKPHEPLNGRLDAPEAPPIAPYKQRVAEAFQHVNDALVALEHYPSPPAGLDDLKKQTRALEQQYLTAFRQVQR